MDIDRKLLLQTARKSLETYFSGETFMIPESDIRRGAFVTLRKGVSLRGCIGYMEGVDTIYREIFTLARNAAFSDYRFPPLSYDELGKITIEISVLTEPKTIPSPADFIPGRDGIIMSLHGRRAVYLPQVAEETGWDKETLLSSLSEKAGLPRESWKKPDAIFRTFQAEVFDESEL